MKQFDIADNPFPGSRVRQPFLLVLQSDLLAKSLDTVVVAPLEPAAAGTFADRLNPHVEIDGQSYALIAQEIRARFAFYRLLTHGPAIQRVTPTCSIDVGAVA